MRAGPQSLRLPPPPPFTKPPLCKSQCFSASFATRESRHEIVNRCVAKSNSLSGFEEAQTSRRCLGFQIEKVNRQFRTPNSPSPPNLLDRFSVPFPEELIAKFVFWALFLHFAEKTDEQTKFWKKTLLGGAGLKSALKTIAVKFGCAIVDRSFSRLSKLWSFSGC